jgi:hypothetical protein
MIEILVFCPGGTRENSPPIYRWEKSENSESPVGTPGSEEPSSVPTGLGGSAAIFVPSTEDAGLLSVIPPGLGCLNGPSPTFDRTRHYPPAGLYLERITGKCTLNHPKRLYGQCIHRAVFSEVILAESER